MFYQKSAEKRSCLVKKSDSSTINNAAVSRKRFTQGEFLKVGDVVELEFEGLGRLRNVVAAEAASQRS